MDIDTTRFLYALFVLAIFIVGMAVGHNLLESTYSITIENREALLNLQEGFNHHMFTMHGGGKP